MIIIDLSNPVNLILVLSATILLIFLAQELKKSYITAILLFAVLALLITHTIQMIGITDQYRYLLTTISRTIVVDFILVLIAFFSYLWVDDIEAKAMNKKSIDNSLDWFWKKV